MQRIWKTNLFILDLKKVSFSLLTLLLLQVLKTANTTTTTTNRKSILMQLHAISDTNATTGSNTTTSSVQY